MQSMQRRFSQKINNAGPQTTGRPKIRTKMGPLDLTKVAGGNRETFLEGVGQNLESKLRCE